MLVDIFKSLITSWINLILIGVKRGLQFYSDNFNSFKESFEWKEAYTKNALYVSEKISKKFHNCKESNLKFITGFWYQRCGVY